MAASHEASRQLDRQAPEMFLKIQGLNGESTDFEYRDWSEIISFSWSVKQPAGSAGGLGQGGAGSSERADFSDFTVAKAVDKLSPTLVVYCARGQHIKEVKVSIRRPIEKQRLYQITLEDAVVSGVSQVAQPGGFAGWLPVESVSFTYSKIRFEYTECDHTTSRAKGAHRGDWDLKANKMI